MTNETETTAQDLSQDELDKVVGGETAAAPAPVQCGFAYAALTVGGVARIPTPTRRDLTV